MLKEILTARIRPSDKALYNIWARKISGGWTETTITGSLPLTFRSEKAQELTDYRIYGTAEGAGIETENLFDYTAKDASNGYGDNVFLRDTGAINSSTNYYISEYIEVSPNAEYTISELIGNTPSICQYDANKEFVSGSAYNNNATMTITTDSSTKYIRLSIRKAREALVMLVPGSSTPTTHIPFGYQIPLSITGGTNTDTYLLYIGDSQLGENEYLDYAEQKIYKDVSGTLTPTDPPAAFPAIAAYQGENTMSSTETVGNVSITGKIKEVI